ncbi:MAG: STAS-like domain-containing protein, partial [Promethearchaeati archaeon]
IMIAQMLSPDLAFRHNAKRLIEELESYPENDVVLDFSDVRTITRSFAHEYLSRKAETSKTIIEIRMPSNVKKMFQVVKNASAKTKLFDKDDSKTILLS